MTDAFPYYQPQTFHANLAGQAIQFVSKPGLPGWDNVSPGAALLADAVQAPPAGQILLLGSGHGALAAILAHRVPQGWLWAADSLASALAMTHKTLEINQVHNAQVLTSLSLAPGTCQAAAMLLPKGRKLARRWLLQAHAALAPGGAFYLAGANDEGIQAVLKDAAQLFGNPAIVTDERGELRAPRIDYQRANGRAHARDGVSGRFQGAMLPGGEAAVRQVCGVQVCSVQYRKFE